MGSNAVEFTSEWPLDPYLLNEDRDRLVTGRWLNRRLIEAAQLLLKNATPDMEGLQSPLNRKSYKLKKVEGRFIQILNVHKSHWIVVSDVGCELGVVNIFDSAYSLDTKK